MDQQSGFTQRGKDLPVRLAPRSTGRRAAGRTSSPHALNRAEVSSAQICVVGGGIAGVCCAQELSRLHPEKEILLVSNTDVLREVTSVMKLTTNLEEISVFERRSDQFSMDNKNIRVLIASLEGIDTLNQILLLRDIRSFSPSIRTETEALQRVPYQQVCICTGSQPRSLFPHFTHPHVLTIRDLDSVKEMSCRLATAQRVVIVGNGGIAMELANALTFCDVVWVVKDKYIGSAFFDATASAFIAPALLARAQSMEEHDATGADASDENGMKKRKFSSDSDSLRTQHGQRQGQQPRQQGSALGPEWIGKSSFLTNLPQAVRAKIGSLRIIYQDEIGSISGGEHGTSGSGSGSSGSSSFPLHLTTKRGLDICCDFVIAACGVMPNTSAMPGVEVVDIEGSESGSSEEHRETERRRQYGFRKDAEGALLVNHQMQTSCKNVFAAGDCCAYVTSLKKDGINCRDGDTKRDGRNRNSKHWFQMRLWTQAKTMGHYAAQCMHDQLHSLTTGKNSRRGKEDRDVHDKCKNCEGESGSEVEVGGGDGDEEEGLANNIVFEVFAHVTRFFGHKVVLLGRYNAQGLTLDAAGAGAREEKGTDVPNGRDSSTSGEQKSKLEAFVREMVVTEQGLVEKQGQVGCALGALDPSPSPSLALATPAIPTPAKLHDLEVWTRVTPGQEYIKVIIHNGRVVGALLLGDTELEEVFENLILNKLDVSEIGVALLDPNLDLEGYMD